VEQQSRYPYPFAAAFRGIAKPPENFDFGSPTAPQVIEISAQADTIRVALKDSSISVDHEIFVVVLEKVTDMIAGFKIKAGTGVGFRNRTEWSPRAERDWGLDARAFPGTGEGGNLVRGGRLGQFAFDDRDHGHRL